MNGHIAVRPEYGHAIQTVANPIQKGACQPGYADLRVADDRLRYVALL